MVGYEIFPTDLRNKGKEIYSKFKKYFDKYNRFLFVYRKYDEYDDQLEPEKYKLKYTANWAIVNNYPSVFDLLIKLRCFPNQPSINIAALKGNIEVLNILGNYIKKTSSSNHPAMLKYLSKGIFPNVKGANLANLNKQHEVLDLLKEFNIYPDYNYSSLQEDANYALKAKDEELLDALESVNILPTVEIKNDKKIILPKYPVKTLVG